jgi:gliding motility-associated-like protein
LQPFAGENAAICQEDSFELNNATAPSFAKNIEWTSSGSGFFVNPSEINTTYIPSPGDILNGVVVLTIHSSSDCATASDQMLLTINESIVVRAGSDAEICENDTYQLNGSVLSSVSGVIWYSTGSGTFNNNELFKPVYTPSAGDIENGNVEIIFEGISSGTCLNATDTLILNINKQPVISAGSDLNTCGSEDVELAEASIIHAETVSWTTSGTGEFNNNKLLHPVYTPSEADIINGGVNLTIHHQSDGVCESVSDVIVLTFSGKPAGNAGNSLTTCFGESIQITEATAQNFSLLSWTSTGSGTIENPNTLSPTYLPADGETGKISMKLMIVGQDACIADTVFDEIEIEVLEPLVANAMDDDTVFYNSSALLSVNVENGSGTYFYNWEPDALVLNPNANYTETVDLTSAVDFEVTERDAETGCIASDFVAVYVEDDSDKLLGFYNAFTPNNDGVNDTWIIEGIEQFPDNEVMIFNRWGDKIIELRNYDNKNIVWDGTNQRGKKVPDGTYYYVVTLNDDKSYTGWIHLRSEK